LFNRVYDGGPKEGIVLCPSPLNGWPVGGVSVNLRVRKAPRLAGTSRSGGAHVEALHASIWAAL